MGRQLLWFKAHILEVTPYQTLPSHFQEQTSLIEEFSEEDGQNG